MQEVNATITAHAGSLDAALRAVLNSKLIGVSTYGVGRPISIWLDDTATPGDLATATALATAHDPVFLSVDKAQITANGSDAATVTVSAPKQGAAAVVLTVNGVDLPIALVAGVGSDTITSLDPTIITVSVKNAANRSTDVITIKAV